MVQTAARLRSKQISVALLDLTALGQNLTPDQWYNGLVGRIGQQLDLEDELEDYWNAHLHMGPLQRWSGAIQDVVLRQRAGRVVIFIDEIDAVRSLPFSTDEFFAGIREFYNRRTQDSELSRLTFCLLGVATPSDLIRDTRTTPFNVGVRVELSDFTEEEAAPLAQGLWIDKEKAQQLVRRVLYWTGGHPYLTQRLCQAIFEEHATTAADVDRVCNKLFLSHRARERDDNLLFVRERMLRNESDLAGLLLLYGKICVGAKIRDDETNPLVTILRLAGIVRVEGGYLRTRNRIYAQVFNKDWVSENLPGAEVRRQRAAYLRGFRIAGIVFASIALVVGAYDLSLKFRLPEPVQVRYKPLEAPAFWASFGTTSVPASKSGGLLITTSEAYVSVFINGAQYGQIGKAKNLLIPVLPEGNYEVRLEKPGYRPFVQPVLPIVAQKESRINVNLALIPQVELHESLLILRQVLPDTKLSVDGAFTGTANSAGELSVKLQPGDHQITLEKPGFLSRDFKIHLNPGNNTVDAKLQPQPDREAADLDAAMRSNDVGKLQEFLNQYPRSKSMSQVRGKMEDVEWARYRDTNDPNQLEVFLQKYPSGQHLAEARRLADQLVVDDVDWRAAQAANTLESFERFLNAHPRSRHVPEANSLISGIRDQAEIGRLLQAYQDSYNHRDLKQLLQLWPSCPDYVQNALNALFKEKRSGTVSLVAKGIPIVQGNMASLTISITKQTDAGESNKSVPFQFRKQNDHWIIEKGSL